MKKKLIAIFTLTAIPVFASCPIDKPCTAVILNDANLPLQQRLIPDRLENLKKTDAFQPKYVTPYEDMLINKVFLKYIIAIYHLFCYKT